MKRRNRVTIRDVAKECGLALSTVSNALAGKRYVGPETKALVVETAQRLGYRASPVARALRMQRSFAIGVLVPDLSNPAFPAYVRGIEDVAIGEDCNLLLCNTDGAEEKQLWHMRALLDRQVDGMVLIAQHVDSPAVRNLLKSGTPYVLLQRRSGRFPDPYVGSDNSDGVFAAVEHLHGMGHRRIAFIQGPAESSTARERLQSFKACVRRLGLDDDRELISPGDHSARSGYEATERFMSLPRRPTAIMASNDINAIGVLECAAERGIGVPSALSVVGCDDIELASFRSINLTTINLPKRQMGVAAGQMLMKRIRAKRSVRVEPIIFSTSLMIRGTTGPCTAGRGST